MLSPHIFRSYDIRGVVGEDFPPGSVSDIGRAYGTFLIRKGTYDALVGHDTRESSPEFAESFIKGLLSTGVSVHYIGHCLTQGLYYARHHYDIDGGAMITASHNPSQYNGFKLCHGLKALSEEELKSLHTLVENGDFERGEGKFHLTKTAMDEYMRAVKHRITLKRPLKVVVDLGNGTGGLFVPRLLRMLGCEVHTLFADVDPTFPNHIPDPVKLDNHTAIIDEVKRLNADIGIMIDGDGDRVGTVDDKGNVWLGDMVLIALMRKMLPDNPGRKVIVEVKNTEAVIEECERLGGVPVFWKTGHALIDPKVAEEDAILAAEMSCHYWVTPNWYVFDDGLFAICTLLQLLSEQDKSYSQIMADIPQYPVTPEYRVSCPEDRKTAIVESAKKYFMEKCTKVIDVDGIRGYYDDGWFLIRQSNTQPVIAVRVEAKTPDGLERVKSFVQEHLNSYPEINLDWERQYDAE